MVNPGAFRGSRKEFLMGEKATYSTGMAGGYGADALATIQRRYFKRYPVDLPHSEEPTSEHLEAVDDDAPDPEPEEPDENKLTAEEYEAALKKLQHRQEVIRYRKAQIKRWMAYQYMKDQDLDPKESGASNPYNALLFQLTGKEMGRPRRKTAVNVWRKTQRVAIDAKVKTRAEGVPKSQLAALRDKVAREMFQALRPSEQDHWKVQAEEESKVALEAWKREMESPPSEDPASQQMCIQGIVRVAQPFLDLMSKATGWKTTLLAGGPEPAHGGRLNVISVHSGLTSGDVKMNFGRAERAGFKQHIVPIFGKFLHKCYTPDECRARALRGDEGFLPVEEEDCESEGANLFSVEPTSRASSVTAVGPDNAGTGETAQERGSSKETETSPTELAPAPPRSRGPTPLPSRASTPVPAAPETPLQPLAGTPAESNQPMLVSARSPPPGPLTSENTGQGPAAPPLPKSPAGQSISVNLNPPLAQSTPGDSGKGLTAPSLRTRKKLPPSVDSGTKEGGPAVGGGKGRGRKRGSEAARVDDSPDANPPPAKRGRTRNNATSSRAQVSPAVANQPDSPLVPLDAPKWFENAVVMLRNDELGSPWATLLQSWTAFEVAQQFEGVEKLKTQHRPPCISDWIKRARDPGWRPTIASISDFKATFMKWWASLQPPWRVSEEGGVIFSAVDGDWERLRRPGLNGLFSIVAALFYWGLAVRKQNEGQAEWLVAVEDFRVVCVHLLSSPA